MADDLSEGDELVVLALLPGDGYQVTTAAQAVIRIVDADPPPLPWVRVLASDPAASEQSPSSGEFTFWREGDLSAPLTVSCTWTGTASAADYLPLPGSITFAAHSRYVTVVVVPVADGQAEGPESVILVLDAGPYQVDAPGIAQVSIADAPGDLPHVWVEATDPDASEGSPSSGAFTFWRDGPLDQPLTLSYVVAGSATREEDYAPLLGSVTIPAGHEYACVPVTATSDGRIEAAETVIVQLREQRSQYAVTAAIATLTLHNVDVPDPDAPPLPTVSVTASGQPAEGSSLPGTFTFTRTGDLTQALTVRYSVAGSATGGLDYDSLPGVVTFAAGADSVRVEVVPQTDPLEEGPETVSVSVWAVCGGTYRLGSPIAEWTITDASPKPRVSVTARDPDASERSPTRGEFLFTRTGDLGSALTVHYVVSGTATEIVDNPTAEQTVTFAAGKAMVVLRLDPLQDGQSESDELATVTLMTALDTGYQVTTASATVTLHDDGRRGRMLAPGGSWNEGTVRVRNTGAGWLLVTGGEGLGVRVTPGQADPGDYRLRLPDEPASPGEAIGGEYAFEVEGLAGPQAGDVTWEGEADQLNLRTTGNVAAISIRGVLTVEAGGSVGDLTADTVTVRAGGTVAAVIAIQDVLAVQAGGDVLGPITAGGDIGSIIAGAEAAPSGLLPAPEEGLVDSPESIEPGQPGDAPEPGWGSPPPAPALATRGNLLGSVTAEGSIGAVVAFGAIEGNITAGGAIGQSGILPDWQPTSGSPMGVWALGPITSQLQAGNGALTARSWAKVSGSITAPGDVIVWAFGELAGSLNSLVGAIRAGTWNQMTGHAEGQGLVHVTAAGDIGPGAYLRSTEESLIADAGGSMHAAMVSAHKHLWVAARSGSVGGSLTAENGWAYVWAKTDIGNGLHGVIQAREDISVTAWQGDLKTSLDAREGEVEAYAGNAVTASALITGAAGVKVETQGDMAGTVIAGTSENWGDAEVRAGGNVSGAVTASGTADVAAVGHVTGDVTASEGDAEIVANGHVSGVVRAPEGSASVWAGGNVSNLVRAKEYADVTAGGDVSWSVIAEDGDVAIHAGGNVGADVWARGNASVEAVGTISGGNIRASTGSAALLANGDIGSTVTARWVTDVRSANGEITGEVTTTATEADRLTAADSPWVKRLALLDARITQLRADKAALEADGADTSAVTQQLADAETEAELQRQGEKTTDLDRIDASIVHGMIADGLAQRYEGDPIALPSNWTLGLTSSLWTASGYVGVADTVGNTGYFMLLEPFRTIDASITPENYDPYPISVIDSGGEIEYYRVACRWEIPGDESIPVADRPAPDPAALRAEFLRDSYLRLVITSLALRKAASEMNYVHGIAGMALSMVPFVGTANDILDGNYVDAAISLGGDAATLLGWGAAWKARKCINAGRKSIKIAAVTSLAVEGGASVTRLGQGIAAYRQGDTSKAYGYFGDATLRLLGLSAQAIFWLKNRPKCFAAGTPVHTQEGPKPIEQVQPGEQVWAFDRVAQQWRLCRVTQTFSNWSDTPLTTVRLSSGDELTGTTGHPIWIIEGDNLRSRGQPDHGGDEPAGPTPGRWVPLAHLRLGDAVLVRAGKTARVVAVEIGTEPQRVYNLEVEGLHCYAVGSCGVLAHNAGGGDCDLRAVSAAKEAVTAAPDKPTIKVDRTSPTTTTSKPSKATTAGKAPPAAKTATPSATPKAKSSSSRDRPRSNGDKRVKHPYVQEGPRETTPMSDTALEATTAEREAYFAAKASGNRSAKKKAGEELGLAGADQYMQKDVKARRVYEQQTTNGNFDLDRVYEKDGWLFVVEAKAPNARPTPRQLSSAINPVTGYPDYSMEGSSRYLRDTIDKMKNGNRASKNIAELIEEALLNGKISYLEVKTIPKGNANAKYSIRKYKLVE